MRSETAFMCARRNPFWYWALEVERGSPKSGTARYPSIEYASARSWRTLADVQRLFFMFPTGLPGLALLLLRASVAIALLAEGYAHRQSLPGWAQAAVILISLVLSAGYLTPIVALAGLAFHAFIWWALGPGSAAAVATAVLDAAALALLGPGAYSIDSHRFGRRVVVLPPP
jgi:hypothetical protein